jgi:hypothetical protein
MIDPATLEAVRAGNRLEDLLPRDYGVKLTGRGREVRGLCPFHADHHPSLRVNVQKQQWYCDPCGKGGDVFKWVMERDRLTFGEAARKLAARVGIAVEPEPQHQTGKDAGPVTLPVMDDKTAASVAGRLGVKVETIRALIAEGSLGYDKRKRAVAFGCQTPDGQLIALHLRGKRPDGERWFSWQPEGCGAQLWRLPVAVHAGRIIVTEGETDAIEAVDAGIEADGFAVIAKTGAGIFPDDAVPVMKGKTMYVIPDHDQAGRDGAAKTAAKLSAAGVAVRIVTLPEMPDGKKDLRDWLGLGHGAPELVKLIEAATTGTDTTATGTLTPPAEVTGETAALPERRRGPEWPQLQDAALYGLAGDIVRAIDPHTEADPVAVLVQFLAAFGNIIGRSAYYSVEATRHGCNLSACLVGKSSKARKGTSWGQVLRLFTGDDADDWQTGNHWARERTVSGLSTGEGVIWAVRDPIIKREAKRDDKGRTVKDAEGRVIRDEVEVDPGVTDKRLLVQEGEFAQLLKQLEREGNTLSPVLRNAWDGAPLRILTKNAPAFATGAHISIVGHITREELLFRLAATEMANGFANRFLWVCVNRSKLLPDGGGEVDLADAGRRLRGAVEFALKTTKLRRDESARALWHREYGRLAESRPGLAGAICGRAEAQVLRLSCLYALLDCTDAIREPHLTAALALWDYCAASVRYIWGDALGNPLADAIRQALAAAGASGLSRTELHKLVGNNRSADEIDRALGLLAEYGLARSEHRQTSGRPSEIWTATGGRP